MIEGCVPARLVVGVIGLGVLGSLTYVRIGPATMWATGSDDWAVMLLAGVFNVLAFGALAKALQITGVVFVNSVNASQTAMAAIAGVVFFREAPTVAMIVGVLLTAMGLMLMKGDSSRSERPEEPSRDTLPKKCQLEVPS